MMVMYKHLTPTFYSLFLYNQKSEKYIVDETICHSEKLFDILVVIVVNVLTEIFEVVVPFCVFD